MNDSREHSSHCALLELPVELRLQIYTTLRLYGTITVTASHTNELSDDNLNNIAASRPTSSRCIPGVPEGHVPVLAQGVVTRILSIPETATLGSAAAAAAAALRNLRHNVEGIRALKQTCSQIRHELYVQLDRRKAIRRWKNGRWDDGGLDLDLVLMYPLGVCVAAHPCFAELLDRARSVRIMGVCELDNPAAIESDGGAELLEIWAKALDRVVNAVLGPAAVKRRGESELQAVAGSQEEFGGDGGDDDDDDDEDNDTDTRDGSSSSSTSSSPSLSAASSHDADDSIAQTSHAAIPRGLLEGPRYALDDIAPTSHPAPPALHMRIFHPDTSGAGAPQERQGGTTTYHGIWAAPASPGPRALAHIHGGAIRLAVYRGRRGTGMEVVARDNGGRGGRMLSALWPRFATDEDDGVGWRWAIGAVGPWDER